jgi:hypothetical protein
VSQWLGHVASIRRGGARARSATCREPLDPQGERSRLRRLARAGAATSPRQGCSQTHTHPCTTRTEARIRSSSVSPRRRRKSRRADRTLLPSRRWGTERPGAPSTRVPRHAVLSARRTFARNTKVVIGTDEPWLLFHPVPTITLGTRQGRLGFCVSFSGPGGPSLRLVGRATPGQGGGEKSPGPPTVPEHLPARARKKQAAVTSNWVAAPVCGEGPPSPRPRPPADAAAGTSGHGRKGALGAGGRAGIA